MERRSPYPGLRPFLRSEVDLFFGRERDVDEIVDRLKANRFLAVLGASGSGKSSLVRTGLFDGLELGLLREAGSVWRFADLKPGGRPVLNLARALLASRGSGKIDPAEAEALTTLLRRGPRSVVEWSRSELSPGTNLLLLVDQFEELFSYDTYARQEQAQAFVNLLIESASEPDIPIYVVLTMRSEYLGACALIDGLAEAINRGQYLTPRLSRDQCRMAIEEPAAVCGVEIESALTNRLLNDLAAFAPWEEPANRPTEGPGVRVANGISQLDRLARRADQLPLMQHILNRLWTQAIDRGDAPPRLRLADYERSGGLRGTLSAHADELLGHLVEAHGESIRAVAQAVFRALVIGASVADAVRRRTRVGKLVELAGGKREEVLAVIQAYRGPRCNFLVTEREELDDDVMVDISHESLIRQWKQLREWVEAEAASAAWWRRLLEDATDWAALATDPARSDDAAARLLRDVELTHALELKSAYRPTPAWAQLYGGGYETVGKYLEASQLAQHARDTAARSEAASRRTRRRLLIGTGGTLAVVFLLSVITSILWQEESRRLDTLQVDTAHAAIDSTLSTAMAIQGTRDWAASGTVITAVTGPLLVLDDRQQVHLHGLKAELESTLDTVLQRQRAAFRARENTRTLAAERPNRSPRQSRDARSAQDPLAYAYYGHGSQGGAAIARVFDRRIEVLATDASDDWTMRRSVRLGDLAGAGSSETLKVSSVALYGSGDHLAIISGDAMFFGALQAFEANDVRPARIRRDRGIATSNASRGSRELEGTYAESSFSTLASCHATSPRFLAFDVDDAAWLISASGDGAHARRLFNGRPPRAYSVDPEGNRYAAVVEQRLYVGKCDGDADPVEIPARMDKGIDDIEFAGPGLLGVAGRAGQIRFIDLDTPVKAFQREEPISIPDGSRFVRFAYDRRIWLTPAARFDSRTLATSARGASQGEHRLSSPSRENTTIELWDATTRKVEGMVIADPRAELVGHVGTSHWLAFTSAGGALSVQKPVWRSTLPLAELAAATVAIGGDVPPPEVEKSTQAAFDLLRLSDIPVRMREQPVAKPSSECERLLERLVDEIERRQGDIRADSVLKLAKHAKTKCEATRIANQDEQQLLAWLRDEIVDNSDAEEIPFAEIRRRAASLSARGNPSGLRLLAIGFGHDRSSSASRALLQAAVELGGQLPHSVLEQARRASIDRALVEAMAQRPPSPDGRDDEIRALSLLRRGLHAEALLHFAAAQQAYLDAGDQESAAAVGRPRRQAAEKLSDNELVALWRRMEQAKTGKSKSAGTATPLATLPPAEPLPLHLALEAVAGRIGDAIARSELLIEAAEAAPNDAAKVGLLMKAVGAAAGAPRRRLEDTPKLAKAARLLADLGSREQAASVIAEHLVRIDTRDDAEDDAVASILDALRVAIDVQAWSAPEPRSRLADMNWEFVNFRWTQGMNDRRRSLLAASMQLQDALFENGVDKTSLKLARARTRFWLGVFPNNEEARRSRTRYFSEAAALLEAVPRDLLTLEIRLQLAEALRWKASTLPLETKADAYAVAEVGGRARAVYEDLLRDADPRPRDDYIRTATVAGLSSVLRALASVGTEIAREELDEGNTNEAREAALGVMRNIYEQSALFDEGRYAGIGENNESAKNLCCLARESQREDAWMVGMLAGAEALARGYRPAPSECERLAAHPYDPQRRVAGTSPEPEAVRVCEHEATTTNDPARTSFLLGRAYSFEKGRREDAIKRLAAAASSHYAQAFFNLSFELSALSRTCSVLPALLDRYRYLVLRDHLEPALAALRDHLRPSDGPVVARLKHLAEAEPETTRTLPKLGDPLPLAFLKGLCE